MKGNQNTGPIHEYSTTCIYAWLEVLIEHMRKLFWLVSPFSIILVMARVRCPIWVALDGPPSHNLMTDLLIMSFNDYLSCEACVKGKQVKSSLKSKNDKSTQKPLELIHLDLFGPTRTRSIGGKIYGLVIVDDFTR